MSSHESIGVNQANNILELLATWMDLETEWSKSDRGEISYGIPYICNLKRNDKNQLIYKTEADSQT